MSAAFQSLAIKRHLDFQRVGIRDDLVTKKKNVVLAALGVLAISAWICEFAIIVGHTEMAPPNQCVDDIVIPHYAFPQYVPAAIACEGIYTLVTIITLYCLVDYYRFQQKAINKRRSFDESESVGAKQTVTVRDVMSGPLRNRLCVELFLCLLQPIPFINYNNPTSDVELFETVKPEFITSAVGFRTNQVNLGLVMFIRLYLCIRLIRDYTTVFKRRRDIEHERMKRGLRPINFNWAYSLRSVYHMHGPVFSLITWCLFTFFFSLALYVAEWNSPDQVRCLHGEPVFLDFYVATYVAIITMTSVGYGDYSAQSFLGRAVACMASVMGVALGSLVVATAMRWFDLSRAEVGVLTYVSDQHFSKMELSAAAVVIQRFWRVKKTWLKQQAAKKRNRLHVGNKVDWDTFEHAYRQFKLIRNQKFLMLSTIDPYAPDISTKKRKSRRHSKGDHDQDDKHDSGNPQQAGSKFDMIANQQNDHDDESATSQKSGQPSQGAPNTPPETTPPPSAWGEYNNHSPPFVQSVRPVLDNLQSDIDRRFQKVANAMHTQQRLLEKVLASQEVLMMTHPPPVSQFATPDTIEGGGDDDDDVGKGGKGGKGGKRGTGGKGGNGGSVHKEGRRGKDKATSHTSGRNKREHGHGGHGHGGHGHRREQKVSDSSRKQSRSRSRGKHHRSSATEHDKDNSHDYNIENPWPLYGNNVYGAGVSDMLDNAPAVVGTDFGSATAVLEFAPSMPLSLT